MSRKKN